MRKTHRIVVIAGDGVGTTIVPERLRGCGRARFGARNIALDALSST